MEESLSRLTSARRIHILGGPGSGKTTLANELGRVRGISVTDLDFVKYVQGAWDERPEADRDEDVAAILARESWVVEGIYLGFTKPFMQQAELIILLEIPTHVAIGRVIKRHAVTSAKGVNKHKGLLKLWRFCRYVRWFYTTTAAERGDVRDPEASSMELMREVLRDYSEKTLALECHQAGLLLRNLARMGNNSGPV